MRAFNNALFQTLFLLNFVDELGPARNSQSCNQKKVDKSNLQARLLSCSGSRKIARHTV